MKILFQPKASGNIACIRLRPWLHFAHPVQSDDQDLWLFSRNNLPPQTATWGEIKEMVRAKRLRGDDLLTPAPGQSHAALPGGDTPALPGVWQTAEEVFQNLPYEEMAVRPRRRAPASVRGFLWVLLIVGLTVVMGAWYESIKRRPAAAAEKPAAVEQPGALPAVPAPPKETPLAFPVPKESASASAGQPLPTPPVSRLVIPPELLQFQRYDSPPHEK